MNATTVPELDAAGAGEALHRVYRMLARWAREAEEAERTAGLDTVGSQTQDGGGTSAGSQRQDVAESMPGGC
jgi:hypothetical protein